MLPEFCVGTFFMIIIINRYEIIVMYLRTNFYNAFVEIQVCIGSLDHVKQLAA